MYTLRNDRLEVSIAEPGKEYVTSRFDRAGFVVSVKLDGAYEFLGQEDVERVGKGSGGAGLCSEIQCDPMSDTVAIGEKFPKFGVGNLTKKEDAPYFFMETYDCDSYEIQTDVSEDRIDFATAAKPIGGYAVSQKKSIILEGNKLFIKCQLKNEGEKEITFDEYCHNFVTLNGKMVNKDYYLTIPCLDMPTGEIKTTENGTCFHSDGVGLSKTEPSLVFAKYGFEKDQMKPVDVYGWKLTDIKEGISIEEIDDFVVDNVVVWSVGDVISPEMFIHKTLQPGEAVSWCRTYVFEKQS